MERATRLLSLPSHTSYVHQPINGSVFAPLKRTLVAETNAVVRPDSGRIQRVERSWMYTYAKEQALLSEWSAQSNHRLHYLGKR